MRRFQVLLLLFFLTCAAALAHPVDEMSMNVQPGESQVRILWRLPYRMVAFMDDNQDHLLSSGEIKVHGSELLAKIAGRVEVLSDGQPAELALEVDPSPVHNPTHMSLYLIGSWRERLGALSFHYDFFPDSPGTRGLIVVDYDEGSKVAGAVMPSEPDFTPTSSWLRRAQAYFFGGMEHIFCGYDHILFLLVLLIPARSLMQIVKTVTAFTVAHSLTLSMSVLGLVSVPPRPVEAVIALSIAAAALLNLREDDNHTRWPIAFAFGLVHGLGFATVLRDQGVTGGDAALPLLSFNLGVEAGQMFIVLMAFPIMMRIQAQGERVTRTLSLSAAGLALYWFFERVFGP